MKKPNFFIIGAPKSGTTAMWQYLSDHPEVFMSTAKEPHYFNFDSKHRSFHNAESYYQLFDEATEEHKAVGEASLWYLHSEVAITNIEKELPDSKYVVMLRNPVDMAHSLHEQQLFSGFEPIKSFYEAWHVQSKRRLGLDIPPQVTDVALLLYRDACAIGSMLNRLLKQIDRERVHIIFQEDLAADPDQVWAKLQGFLGIRHNDRTEFPIINQAKARKSLLLMKLCFWFYENNLINGKTAFLKRYIDKIEHWNLLLRPRPKLEPDFRSALYQSFLYEVEIVERLTGRDLASWKF